MYMNTYMYVYMYILRCLLWKTILRCLLWIDAFCGNIHKRHLNIYIEMPKGISIDIYIYVCVNVYEHMYVCICVYIEMPFVEIYLRSVCNYRMADTHRIPYRYGSLSAKEAYNEWLFCGNKSVT